MTRLKINSEYAKRHLFVVAVFLSLSGWFGYDGFVRYPAQDAAALYESIEKSSAPADFDLEEFKLQKIQSQKYFSYFLFVFASVVLFRLWRSFKFDFSWNSEFFVVSGVRRSLSEITAVDKLKWEKTGIAVISGKDFSVKLDSWHHVGVKEFISVVDEKLAAGDR